MLLNAVYINYTEKNWRMAFGVAKKKNVGARAFFRE